MQMVMFIEKGSDERIPSGQYILVFYVKDTVVKHCTLLLINYSFLLLLLGYFCQQKIDISLITLQVPISVYLFGPI
jgi:hypothetical protein